LQNRDFASLTATSTRLSRSHPITLTCSRPS
jgi:hypothetical protein